MRKLIVEEWISLDGYAEDKNGTTKYFPSSEANKESDLDQLKKMEAIDTILLGRKTYQIFADYWPSVSAEKEIMAESLNSKAKLVVSNTLEKAPWGNFPDATILKGDAIDNIKQLKEQEGKDIIVWGSISLVQALVKADLVDEFYIQVCPTMVGGGKSLFGGLTSYKNLQMVESKRYPTGVVLLRYKTR